MHLPCTYAAPIKTSEHAQPCIHSAHPAPIMPEIFLHLPVHLLHLPRTCQYTYCTCPALANTLTAPALHLPTHLLHLPCICQYTYCTCPTIASTSIALALHIPIHLLHLTCTCQYTYCTCPAFANTPTALDPHLPIHLLHLPRTYPTPIPHLPINPAASSVLC